MLSRDCLISILGIRDEGNLDLEWNYEVTCDCFSIRLHLMDRHRILHRGNFPTLLPHALTYFFRHILKIKFRTFNNCSYSWDEANKVWIPSAEEDRLQECNYASFRSIKKTTQTGIGASFSLPDDDKREDDESYDLSVEDAPPTVPIDKFQTKMRAAFELLPDQGSYRGGFEDFGLLKTTLFIAAFAGFSWVMWPAFFGLFSISLAVNFSQHPPPSSPRSEVDNKTQAQTPIVKHGPKPSSSRYKIYRPRPDPSGSKIGFGSVKKSNTEIFLEQKKETTMVLLSPLQTECRKSTPTAVGVSMIPSGAGGRIFLTRGSLNRGPSPFSDAAPAYSPLLEISNPTEVPSSSPATGLYSTQPSSLAAVGLPKSETPLPLEEFGTQKSTRIKKIPARLLDFDCNAISHSYSSPPYSSDLSFLQRSAIPKFRQSVSTKNSNQACLLILWFRRICSPETNQALEHLYIGEEEMSLFHNSSEVINRSCRASHRVKEGLTGP
ncbi:hypothetical protein M9H77_35784 [Catharanthus roseus]|uniref:Uncharacterized protein n=1 Tax=Catharanthus roseus TaxID=4058 RepID=A0ACB9ZQX4_CATRO|nr:hypothetical protein M9H77_35784 [Catharanthus roseus]